MNILIIGSGGREHAIAWAVAKSPKAGRIYCAPGNAGIAQVAECVPIGAMEFEKLAAFAKEHAVDLTIVGMDDPLVGGIVDVFESEGLRIFGPRKNAAILEGSKAFSKDLMKKYGIPTADYVTVHSAQEAREYLERASYPIVLKADGLALGKGVLICNTREEALDGVKEIMEDRKFGDSGNTMVIEEFLTGREISVLSFVDGKTIRTMASAMDHKRAGDGDTGPNTGGMGNFSPSPFYTEDIERYCKEHIYQRTVDAMAAEGRPFTGVIFFGLILTANGPDGTLDRVELDFSEDACLCVVLASDGYPVHYEKGYPIHGLETFEGREDEFVFHAGTKAGPDGTILTNGGRVLAVTALAPTLKEARRKAYAAAGRVSFENQYMRHDIGHVIDEM